MRFNCKKELITFAINNKKSTVSKPKTKKKSKTEPKTEPKKKSKTEPKKKPKTEKLPNKAIKLDINKVANEGDYSHNINNSFLFSKGCSIAFMLNINKRSDIYKFILQNREDNNISANLSYNPHMTLHMMNINMNHHWSHGLIEQLPGIVFRAYNDNLKNKELKNHSFNKLGEDPYIFWALKYQLNDKIDITNFRTAIYNEIDKWLVKKNTEKSLSHILTKNGENYYYIFSVDDQPLFGIKNWYFGKGNWEPHISVFTMGTDRDYTKKNPFETVNNSPDKLIDTLIFKDEIFNKILISQRGNVIKKQKKLILVREGI